MAFSLQWDTPGSRVAQARNFLVRTAHRLWHRGKCWRSFSAGPVALFFRLGRRVPVSNNFRRALQRRLLGLVRTKTPPAELKLMVRPEWR